MGQGKKRSLRKKGNAPEERGEISGEEEREIAGTEDRNAINARRKKHGAKEDEADSKRPTKHAKAKQSKGRAQPPQMAGELERGRKQTKNERGTERYRTSSLREKEERERKRERERA
jgi:hypothetical protein